MDDKLFAELVESIQQAGQYLWGEIMTSALLVTIGSSSSSAAARQSPGASSSWGKINFSASQSVESTG
jgi:hypothetical protein